jgi:hypothetical protein
MPEWIKYLKTLIDHLAFEYRKTFILAFVGWTMILFPNQIWEKMGLAEIFLQFRPWIYLASIFATLLIIGHTIFDLIEWGRQKIEKSWQLRTSRQQQEYLLKNLSNIEKEILAQYYLKDTTTIAFNLHDGVVDGLVKKHVLFMSGVTSKPASSMKNDFNVQPWVWHYIKEHPDFLRGIELSESKSKSDKPRAIKTNLPGP